MGHLRIKANYCSYKEKDKRLKQLLINSINDDDMMTEIIKELTQTQKMNEITSGQMLSWARKVKVQQAQKTLIETTKDNKELYTIKKHEQKNNTSHKIETCNNCKCCGYTHQQIKCPAYGKSSSMCGRVNHFKQVCKKMSREGWQHRILRE